MDPEELLKRLMEVFLGELEEHVQALNRDLLALEKEPPLPQREELLRTVFRTVHSLKGASHSVHVELMESACHKAEGIIADVRDGRLLLRPPLFQLLFATVDGIEDAAKRLREKRDLSDAPLRGLLPRLEGARGASPSALAPEPKVAVAPTASAGEASTPAASFESKGIVRITSAKLDTLLAASSELLVARRRLDPRLGEVEALLQFLARWRVEWRRSARPLGKALGAANGAPVAGHRNGSARPLLSRRTLRDLEQVSENLERTEKALDALLSGLAADQRAIERAAGSVEEEVRRARMVPFQEACEGLERAARDVAQAAGKQVDLVVRGADVELDRSVAGALKDPLLHLVRNAVDHGIEAPGRRIALGKAPRGRVEVAAALYGERVRITVTDDGAGLDVGAVRDAAARRKLAPPADVTEAARVIFQPGFSTTRVVTEVSGRGVGLDVVRSAVEAVHGSAECEPRPDGGLSMILDVPLTLTTVRAVLLSVGGHIYALPQGNVENLLRIAAGDVRTIEGREVVLLGGTPVPLGSMPDILGLPPRNVAQPAGRTPAVQLFAGDSRAVFPVDDLLAEQDLVVTNLGRRLRRVRHVIGGTLLPSGRIALILNPVELVRTALGRAPRKGVVAAAAPAKTAMKRLLVVDDSVTTRTLVKSILEGAGYSVITAADGVAAWQLLQERGADLVVSDVEMPRMDGCDLARAIRGSLRFRKLPVVLVTALDSAEDKARGMEAGADAYLVKSAFDQKHLLATIAQLV